MKNNLLTDHTKLVVGQKLWHILQGEVIFLGHMSTTGVYCLLCIDSKSVQTTYTNEGKRHTTDEYPSLYLSNPFEQLKESEIIEYNISEIAEKLNIDPKLLRIKK